MQSVNENDEKLKLFMMMVNGNRVYRWAKNKSHAEILVRNYQLKKFGRYKITDCRIVRNRN